MSQPYRAGPTDREPARASYERTRQNAEPGEAAFGRVGGVFAGVGAVMLLLALTVLEWGSGGANFRDINHLLRVGVGVWGMASAYFGWLAWTLTIVLIVVAITANVPTRASGPLRVLGGAIGAAGIVFTFLGIYLSKEGGSYNDYLRHVGIGFYFAVAGFLFAGIGALIGPRHS